MNSQTLENEIQNAVAALYALASQLTWNTISSNYKFITTEITNSNSNFQEQRKANRKINDKKTPVPLDELMPMLQTLYNDLYDVNLHIYRATRKLTIIDVRYLLKSSLDKVTDTPPMLHCKVSIPPGHSSETEKFDINWEHYEGVNALRAFWMKLNYRIR